MSTTHMPAKTIHHGNNVKRLREILRVKQDLLAEALGMSQQNVSLLEQKEKIDKEVMEIIAKALNVPVEAIENFDEDTTVNIITNHFTSNDTSTQNAVAHPVDSIKECTFNPLDEFLKMVEKNEKLYQQLVASEREKVALLEKLLNK